jgi:hypothetical protein
MAVGGITAIYENNRDWQTNDLLAAHEAFLERYSISQSERGANDEYQGIRYSRFYRDIDYEQELSQYFSTTMKSEFRWDRQMSIEDFYRMATTSTQFKRAEIAIGADSAKSLVFEYAKEYGNTDGLVNIDFVTCLYAAK